MYHIIYLIIHAIFRVCTTLTSFLSVLEQYLRSLFYAKTANENDLFLTELGKTGLIKVPQHVAIIFNDTNQKLEPLARLIRWIILTGVRYITFYDFRGNLVEIRPDIVKRMEQIKLDTQHQGLNPKHDSIFYYLNPTLNTSLISSASRVISKSDVTPGDISIPVVEECIRNLMPEYSDPDLAIYFDDHCCTYGLSPWHIRLTEFAQVKLDSSLKLESYLNVLYRYSKCEQRFGK